MKGLNLPLSPCKGDTLPNELIPQNRMVGLVGVEPTTHGLENRCSIQMSYNPIEKSLVRTAGFQPTTPALGRRNSMQLSYIRAGEDGES